MSTMIVKNTTLMYPQLAEPKAWEGAEAKYSVKCLIPKSDPQVKDILAAGEKEIDGTTWNATVKAAVKKIMKDNKDGMNDFALLKDGDALNNRREAEGKEKIPAYAGHYVLTVGIKAKLGAPLVVGRDAKPMNTDDIQREIYSGVKANISFSFYAYSKPKPGLTTTLKGVQKVLDGERLGVHNPFEALEVIEHDEISL